MKKDSLLKIEDLSVSFADHDDRIRILDDVSLAISEDEILGLVGESGSGKTVTALSIMRLLDPAAKIEQGRICFRGEDLLANSQRDMEHIRGSQISMIFQNPRSSLNPLKRVLSQVAKSYGRKKGVGRVEALHRATELLKSVGFPDVERRARSYPHQLSTGMCQRVMIAMMIASSPDLLIADEATTALDPTIADQIYQLLHKIRQRTRMSILIITHDLGLVAENCHRVAVMHAGHIVETAKVETIFEEPGHPYTSYLVRYIPRVDRKVALPSVRTTAVEEVDYASSGCRYARKCKFAMEICFGEKPEMQETAPGHWVRCHFATPEGFVQNAAETSNVRF